MAKTVVLSQDVAKAFPRGMGVRYEILRSHEEEVTTGWFGRKKEKVTVIDDLRITGFDVYSLEGLGWQIALKSPTQGASQTSETMEVSSP